MTTTLLTGATTGVGLEIARGLALTGHRLIIGARDPGRGAAAENAIRSAAPQATVEHRPLDLASLTSVRAFCAQLPTDALDCLILNAAVMTLERKVTTDGFEMMFGTNVLGHFALVGGLAEQLSSSRTRIVTQSSESHRPGRLDFDDIQHERRFSAIAAYNASKFAQHVLAVELDRRLDVTSVVAQPGWVNSDLGREMLVDGSLPQRLAFRVGNRLVGQSPAQGARAALSATLSPDMPRAGTGRYMTPSKLRRLRGEPKVDRADPRVLDAAIGRSLWSVAEELTGVRPGESEVDARCRPHARWRPEPGQHEPT